jgi:hypothetical protein
MKRLTSVFFLTAGLMFAQPSEPNGTVTGTEKDARSGSPIVHAEVALNCVIPRSLQKTVSVLTAANGAFRFTHALSSLDRGGYCTASASHIGYQSVSNISVGSEPVILELVPHSVIRGTVLDENGRPFTWAQVQLYRPVLGGGSYAINSVGQALADDRGRFRLTQLTAGTYRVCVTPAPSQYLSSQHVTYDRICSPAISESSPDWLPMKVGETLDLRFDFKLLHGVPVSCHLSNFQPYPLMQLLREGPDGRREAVGTHKYDPATSTLEFPAVVPGEYLIDIQSNSSGALLRADQRVTVGSSEVSGLELSLRPIPELVGRVTSDDGSALPEGQVSISFSLVPRGSLGPAALVSPDGTFKEALFSSESYWIDLSGPGLPWHIQSVKQAGIDITGRPLKQLPDRSWGAVEVVVSRSHGSLQGVLHVQNDQDYVVRILRERGTEYTVLAVAGFLGPGHTFEFKDLPPGDYRVVLSKRGVEFPYLEPTYVARRSQFFATLRVVDGQATMVELDPVPNDSDPFR